MFSFNFKEVIAFKFKKVSIVSKYDLELLILELLPFVGFSANFDLTGLNLS
jgi:hypothetical protein